MKFKKLLLICISILFIFGMAACMPEVTKYTVKFVDYNDEILLEQELNAGETPVYTAEDPKREGNAEFSYTFIGWNKVIAPVTEDVVYKAVYQETINEYTINFVDEDGTVLDSVKLPYGQTPSYTKNTPERESTAEYTYTFKGWDKEIGAVTGNVTYVAQYNAVKNSYKVSFVDLNNNVLYEGNFEYGTMPTYEGQTPTLEGNVQYCYVFSGWDKELAPVTGDATYRVTFEQKSNEYLVTFKDEDGNVLESKNVPYGTVPEFTAQLPALPENNAQYTYTGAWDKDLSPVTGEAEYIYVISATVNEYTVIFKNEDGTVWQEQKYAYGQMPGFAQTPVQESTAQYSYTFTGWDKEITEVTGDAVYTAVYEAKVNVYTIKFVDENGAELQISTLEYGATPEFTGTLPEIPENDEYNSYIGAWDKEFETVVGDATYTFVINKTILKTYNVEIKHLKLDGTKAAPTHYGNYIDELVNPEANGTYLYTAPIVEGLAANCQYLYITVKDELVSLTIWYSEVDVWDGTSISAGLTVADPDKEAGTAINPYLITSGADLAYLQANFATYSSSYIKMTKSIDISKNGNFMLNGTLSGVFDGNNCSVLGLNITGKEKRSFFYIVTGTVQNLTLYGNVSLTGNKAAAFAEYVSGGKLINCTNYCSVSGNERVGPFVADHANGGTYTNCVNYGDIRGKKYVGGIAGYTGNTPVFEGCVNYGKVIATSDYAGGIAGRAGCKSFNNCINYGDVISGNYAGAITAQTWYVVTNCTNYGTITAKQFGYAGVEGFEDYVGLVGYYADTIDFTGSKDNGTLVTKTISLHTIKFVNYNDEVILTLSLIDGEMPVYNLANPTREADAQYTYTFIGWDKDIVATTGEAVYKAVYSETVNVYTVTFADEDGTVLEQIQLPYGETPVFSKDEPTKEGDVEKTYEFAGWDKDITSVVGDVTYTAKYNVIKSTFTIKFVDENGTELQVSELEYGEMPVFTGTLPTLPEGDEYHSYTGAWDKEFVVATEAATYTYVITRNILKPYNVEIKHLNLDGTVAAPTHYDNYVEGHSAYQANGTYIYTAPVVEGYAASHQYIYFNTTEELLTITIYYSEVDVWDGTSVSSGLSGSGTEEDPYLITSGADLAYLQANFATYSSSYIKMTKSIDISKNGNFMLNGTLSGVFDGNNCSVLGLNITGKEKRSFFFIVTGTVKDLTMYGSVSLTGNKAAAFAEYVSNGKFINCANYCSVSGKERVGGIAGDLVNGGSFTNCVNYGTIQGSVGVGGIVGYTGGNSVYEGCVNYGTVNATTKLAGGIAGRAGCKSFNNCVNYGNVTSAAYAGGITGQTWYVVTNCFNYGTITAPEFGFAGVEGFEDYVGLVGYLVDTINFTGSKDYGETVTN